MADLNDRSFEPLELDIGELEPAVELEWLADETTQNHPYTPLELALSAVADECPPTRREGRGRKK